MAGKGRTKRSSAVFNSITLSARAGRDSTSRRRSRICDSGRLAPKSAPEADGSSRLRWRCRHGLVAVGLAATSLVPNQVAGPGATLSHPPSGASSPVRPRSAAAPSRSVVGQRRMPIVADAQPSSGIQGLYESPQPELRFGMSATGLTVPADAPHSIVPAGTRSPRISTGCPT